MNDDFFQNTGNSDQTEPNPQADNGSSAADSGAARTVYDRPQEGSYSQPQQGGYNQQQNNSQQPYGYGQTQYQQYGQPVYAYPNAAPQKGDSVGFGVASLVLGILSIFLFSCCVNYITALLAIIFGIVQIVKSNKRGMAIAGLITSVVSILLSVMLWIGAFSSIGDFDQFYDEIFDEYYDRTYDDMPIYDYDNYF